MPLNLSLLQQAARKWVEFAFASHPNEVQRKVVKFDAETRLLFVEFYWRMFQEKDIEQGYAAFLRQERKKRGFQYALEQGTVCLPDEEEGTFLSSSYNLKQEANSRWSETDAIYATKRHPQGLNFQRAGQSPSAAQQSRFRGQSTLSRQVQGGHETHQQANPNILSAKWLSSQYSTIRAYIRSSCAQIAHVSSLPIPSFRILSTDRFFEITSKSTFVSPPGRYSYERGSAAPHLVPAEPPTGDTSGTFTSCQSGYSSGRGRYFRIFHFDMPTMSNGRIISKFSKR
ncbi:hypothetical protein DXG03_001415 [Asterophora parasitica]|uniref:Uncharacterized protein n=1 Tax=Asterophora parasitica TaxID=117018 RepID=A0A9P7GCX2_9AGAR|nr:hypothetical protein DXG03_001415 [Asterophora parasitica]